ncbi:MAG TPA: glycosyltransferase [Tenuifilaceae bacterium]|nr:glycosyltransferase [Tenuifilaceae bacterium]HNV80863.1 glycosyltransferase [Tenuifilaceae bacterium]
MIEWFSAKQNDKHKFSIMIPTWNNLEMLKLCLASIEKNSKYKHQIIIHINDGSDGTLQWIKNQGFDHTHSAINVGVCWAVNACRALVKTDYIVYLNDDMYLLPNWDAELWDEIERIGHKYFFLSSTTIEPRKSPHPGILSPYDFGSTPEDFRESELLNQFQSIKAPDWSGATWPPNIVHRDIWDLIGGYSVEYFPGLYSDPDFSMKLFEAGVRVFKGVDKSRAYHFGSKSTKRIKMNKGSKQFLNKWGITSASFTKFYLKRGQPYSGVINVNHSHPGLKRAIAKSILKRIMWSFSGHGRTLGPNSK